MSTTEGALGEGENSESANLLKRNSDDVGWEYGVLVDPNNKDKVKCKLCKEMRGLEHARISHRGIRYVYWPSSYIYCNLCIQHYCYI